jgi:hypothetical protein
MRRKIWLALTAAIAAAVAITIPLASASDSGSVTIVRVDAVGLQEAIVDATGGGFPDVGDYVIRSHKLFRNGDRVGTAGTQVMFVAVSRGNALTNLTSSVNLPGGHLTAQGLVRFPAVGNPESFRLAITGGTGDYQRAHGVMTVSDVGEDVEHVLFRIIR